MNELVEKILKLKKEKNAVILAHNYQLPEVQDIADISGDSLELSRRAKETDADVIVFCGVRFMAETAHILNPDKKVLLPDPTAGCPLANMMDVDTLKKIKAENPGSPVVCYINSTADVKAESDVACTSANAVKVVQNLKTDKPIIFIPDQHLGAYVQSKTGRDLILTPGYCVTHRHVTVEDIQDMKDKMPGSAVIAHPECSTDVLEIADFVCSTSQMVKAVEDSPSVKQFIIGTEAGMLHRLRKTFPDREFFVPSARCVCPNMKKTTLEKVLWSLERLEHEIILDVEIREKALGSLERMLQYV